MATETETQATEPESTGYMWRNWSREQVCHPEEIVTPRTREGLVRAVIEAHEAGRRVKVAGSGHSFTDTALTDGTLDSGAFGEALARVNALRASLC